MTRLASITTAAATALVAAAVSLPVPQALAADETPPTGVRVDGIHSPVSGTLELSLYARDTGIGLANAEATLGGGAKVFLRLGHGSCPGDPSPGTESAPAPGDCPESVSGVPIPIDTRGMDDGLRRLRVSVTDGAGNTTTREDWEIEVRNAPAPPGSTVATVTVGIASGGEQGPAPPGGGKPPNPPPGKGRRGCEEPRLFMRLAARPLWYTPRGIPVLRYLFPYPYRGRLTCLRDGRRVPAPNGTKVHVFYRTWRRSFGQRVGPVRTVRRAPIPVANGRLYVRLGFRTGRTIVFRYRSPEGELAQALVNVAVAPRGVGRADYRRAVRRRAKRRAAQREAKRRAGRGRRGDASAALKREMGR